MASETGEPDPIVVNVTPTLPDFMSFSLRFRFFQSRGLVVYGIILLGGFLYAAYMARSLAMQLPPGPITYISIAAMLCVPVAMLVVLPLGTRSMARRQWQASPELREPREYTFTAEGMRVAGATFAAFVAWPNVTTAVRVGEQVMLGTGQQFFLVPLWAFGTDADRRRFCELVGAKVEGARL